MTQKPPPMVLGVGGIEATPITMNDQAPKRIDWTTLAALPPFQRYVQELAPAPADRDPHKWAYDYAVRYSAQKSDQEFIDQYCKWHQAKGLWPNETPFGELKTEVS